MPDLTLSQIMSMQKALKAKHPDWTPLTPEYGRSCMLWMVEELGEAVAIVKKCDEKLIMQDEKIRAALAEEFADVLMFMNDALICYGITAEEFAAACIKKHERNMNRDWDKTWAAFAEKLREGVNG